MISIIINNYNYSHFLKRTIESALEQTWSDKEVIVVDDGSTDDSKSVIESFGCDIRSVYKSNGGQASAFNAGFAEANGEWVLLLDSDDLILPDTLERLMAIVENRSEVVNVQFRMMTIDENDQTIQPERWMPSFTFEGDPLERLLKVGAYKFSPTSGNFYKREALSNIFPMPETDWRICADAYVQTCIPFQGKVHFTKEIFGKYRIHSKNNHCRNEEKTIESMAQSLFYRRKKIEALKQQAKIHSLSVSSRLEYYNTGAIFKEWCVRRVYEGERFKLPLESRLHALINLFVCLPHSLKVYPFSKQLKGIVNTLRIMFASENSLKRLLARYAGCSTS